MDDARIYIQTRKAQQDGEMETLEETEQYTEIEGYKRRKAIIELTNDDNAYLNRKRNYGEGEIRIGEQLNLNDDIYSIGFIS